MNRMQIWLSPAGRNSTNPLWALGLSRRCNQNTTGVKSFSLWCSATESIIVKRGSYNNPTGIKLYSLWCSVTESIIINHGNYKDLAEVKSLSLGWSAAKPQEWMQHTPEPLAGDTDWRIDACIL